MATYREIQDEHVGGTRLDNMAIHNRYRECAINSHSMIMTTDIDPRTAWQRSASHIFGATSSSAKKGCPRDTFLGLCEAGRVKGVRPGSYTRSQKKEYALGACARLLGDPNLGTLDLRRALAIDKSHNGQMDVMVALWQRSLIYNHRRPQS